MPRFSPIIVTGMHRSGTSLMASMLEGSSFDIGQHLLPGDSNNPLGYFEDIEFLEFQRIVLSECCSEHDGGHPDWGWTETESLDRGAFTRYETEARALLSSRLARERPWGWKDPRTTLLLDFWSELLEDSRYILVYRFPWDVADSMQRLGAEVFLRNPEYAYQIWTYYNRHIRDFYRKNSDRCLLVSIDAFTKNPHGFCRLLRDKLGLQIEETKLQRVYQNALLKSVECPDPLIDFAAAVWPSCVQLLAEIDGLADVSGADLWRTRPLRSTLSSPDANAPDACPVDLSIVTPCYNHGTLLIEAIASIERVAPPRCELIIINDGSDDPRTLEILDTLKRSGYCVVDQENLGLSSARNRAIRVARGRYVLPLDADNRLRPGFIEQAIAVLDSDQKVGVVYGDRYDFGLRRGVQAVPDFDLDALLRENYIDACAVFRRQIWEECGGYDSALSALEDWDLWISAAEKGWHFHHLRQVSFDYRVRPGSLLETVAYGDTLDGLLRHIQTKHFDLYLPRFVRQLAHAKAELSLRQLELRLARTEVIETDQAPSNMRQLVPDGDKAQLSMEKGEGSGKENEDPPSVPASGSVAEEEPASSLADAAVTLSARAAQQEASIQWLHSELHDRDAQLHRIRTSLGWRLLSLYGPFKYRYLLPLYRLLGHPPRDETEVHEQIQPPPHLVRPIETPPPVEFSVDSPSPGIEVVVDAFAIDTASGNPEPPWQFSAGVAALTSALDCSTEDIEASQSARISAISSNVRSVAWFIPDFQHPHYGGIRTIFRFADYFQAEKNVTNTFVLVGTMEEATIRHLIAEAFPRLSGCTVRSVEPRSDPNQIGESDAAIATLWTTAYSVVRYKLTSRKFYFLQDYEPLFYPAGSVSALAEATYRFGFFGIANTPTLKDLYEQEFGGIAESFYPCVDLDVFYPARSQRTGIPANLFFYGRPDQARNAFELGVATLKEVKHRLGDDLRIICAGANWEPAAFGLEGVVENLGLLGYQETGELYRQCDAGLVMMFTKHPSYIPLELMASGCIVVTNHNRATSWLLVDGENCLLAEASVTSLASALERALVDRSLRERITTRAGDDVRERFGSWDREMDKIYTFMCDPLARHRAHTR